MRTVMCVLNGRRRPAVVRDRPAESTSPANEVADRKRPPACRRPFAAGDAATIEAMKIEAAITSPRDGKGVRVAVARIADVAGGDLLPAIG